MLGLGLTPPVLSAQRAFRAAVFGTVVEHRVDAGFGLERASGPGLGGEAALQLGTRWEFALRLQGASLTARTTGALERDVAEVGVTAGMRVLPWLTLRAGGTRRIHTTPLARQRWAILDVGGEVRAPMAGGGVHAVARGAVLPIVAVNGLRAPTLAFSAATGLEYGMGASSLTVLYSLERADFSPQRHEQLSLVTLRLAIRFGAGRRPAVRGRAVP